MPDLGEAPVFYSARPAVAVDGEDEPDLAAGLLSFMVEESTDGLYRCEASFGNWGSKNGSVGYLHFARDKLDFGKPFAVEAGSGDARGAVFKGLVTGIEGNFPPPTVQPTITILAEDRLQELRMTRRTRTFEDVSDADVFNAVASEHELRAEVDVDGPTYPVLAQVNQSDLAFVRDRARAIDAEVWLEDDRMHVQARSRRRTSEDPTLTYKQGLREWSVCADLAGQRTSVSVSGWDVTTKEEIRHEAGEDAIRNELGGDQSGLELLEDIFGPRPEAIVHTAPFDESEARAWAEANCRRMARRFVTGRGVAEGDARLRVGTMVSLQGIGPLFSGSYHITSVRHFFDPGTGFRTAFCAERPGLGS